MSDEIKQQISDIIEGEIQNGINDYIEKEGKGFKGQELIASLDKDEVDRLVKQYKKLKKFKKSNLGQVQRLGLVDKNGKPLK